MQYSCSMLSSIEILILSAIQGIFEFLPVSSAAHLFLISKFYNFVNQNLLIDICLHLGSLLAIIIYFRNDLFTFIKNKNFLIKILIGTIPIIPAGYIIYQTGLINHLRNLEIIGWTSLVFGILFRISKYLFIYYSCYSIYVLYSAFKVLYCFFRSFGLNGLCYFSNFISFKKRFKH